jgi:hypothetical protein
MFTVTDRYVAAVHNDHTMLSRVGLYNNGDFVQYLEFNDGNLRMDDTALRTSGDLTLTEDELDSSIVPSDTRSDNLLEAGFTEGIFYRGIMYDDGTVEWIPFPRMVLDEIRIDDSGAGLTIQLQFLDQAIRIARNKFRGVYWIPDGTIADTAIHDLLKSRLPGVNFVYTGTPGWTLNNRIFQAGDDPWQSAFNIAKAIGCELYFNESLDPTVICEPVPSIDSDPVDSYVEGPGTSLLYANKIRNMEGVVNRVVVLGEATKQNNIPRGIAEDLNPKSLTYVPTFGPVTYVTTMSSVKTDNQAQRAADARLFKMIGRPERLELQALVNAGLRLNDCITVERDKAGIQSNYFLDKLTIPMTHNRAANLSTRERRLLVDS